MFQSVRRETWIKHYRIIFPLAVLCCLITVSYAWFNTNYDLKQKNVYAWCLSIWKKKNSYESHINIYFWYHEKAKGVHLRIQVKFSLVIRDINTAVHKHFWKDFRKHLMHFIIDNWSKHLTETESYQKDHFNNKTISTKCALIFLQKSFFFFFFLELNVSWDTEHVQ